MSHDPSSIEYRRAYLEHLIAHYTTPRTRVVSKTETSAILVEEAEKPNHILHLLMCLVTVGLWIFVWLLMVGTSKAASTRTINIDDQGTAHVTLNGQPLTA